MTSMHTLLALLALSGCQQASDPWARAAVIETLSDAIGGPKGLAQPGDYILENDRMRVAIVGNRVSFGPSTTGGTIIDADLQRDDPRYLAGHGNDQLAELFPTVNLNIQQENDGVGTIEILSDGSDGGAAVICTEGPEVSFLTMLDPLWAMQWSAIRPIFRMQTLYTLEPGSPALHMRTTAVFADESPCDVPIDSQALPSWDEDLPVLEYALEDGLAVGDFYLQGGSVDVFTPQVGFDEGSYIQDLIDQGVNTFTDPMVFDFIAGVSDKVSYALAPDQGRLFVPLFTSSQTVAVGAGVMGDGTKDRFQPGEAWHYDRWFTVGRGDVGSVVDNLLEARGVETGRVDGFVAETGTGVALSGVHVFVYKPGEDRPWSEWTTDVGDDPHPDGSFGGTLPVGDWEIMVHAEGRPDGQRIPITVTAGDSQAMTLESPQPGSVTYTVVDETNRLIPSKVTFFATGDSPRDSILGDGYIASNPAQVSFTYTGHGQVVLPPGEYYAVASRGLEYELGTSDTFTIDNTQTVDLGLQVVHSVDTDGWVSADLHVHAKPSFDSGITLPERVVSMTAEGVEFFAGTDHDVITDYRPIIADLGLEEWVTSAIGIETTTLELGHFLGFPLVQDVMGDAGGALDWTGLTPDEIFQGIRDLGDPKGIEPVVFVGHPRDGILGYFDQYALDPNASDGGDVKLSPGLLTASNPLLAPDNFSLDLDAMEVLNAKRFELIRTPTQPELDAYAEDGSLSAYDMIARPLSEQEDLADGVYKLGYGHEGQIDDWFTLLNLGYRITALGNSDSHDFTKNEAGCPRNYIASDTDDAGFIDEAVIAQSVREGKVITSYGPFMRFFSGSEDNGPGSTVTADGPVPLTIEVQAPTWMAVDRVELYENGTMVREWTDLDHGDTLRMLEDIEVQPTKDSWYVVIAMGDEDLNPVFTPVTVPPIQLQDVVIDALGPLGFESLLSPVIPIPRAFPIMPYAVANPIWVDVDGDGEITPPGLPEWLSEPDPPER